MSDEWETRFDADRTERRTWEKRYTETTCTFILVVADC